MMDKKLSVPSWHSNGRSGSEEIHVKSFDEVLLSVYRRIGKPGRWFLSSGSPLIPTTKLKSKDIEQAKAEAVETIGDRINSINAAYLRYSRSLEKTCNE